MTAKRTCCFILLLSLFLGAMSFPGTNIADASTAGWVYENSDWYYIRANGTKATGWLTDNSQRYYLRSNGAMATGWLRIGTAWYYFNPSGAMATGWIQDGASWYYLRTNGTMQTGWLQLGTARYYLKPNGDMATGWLRIGTSWYYFNPSGVMATGWVQDGSNWYYMRSTGTMQTGWLQLGGARYYLRSDGRMATGWLRLDSKWHLFTSSGALATNGWAYDGTSWYFLDSSGQYRTGWFSQGGKWYYLGSSGAMHTGWLKDGNSWYFLTPSGVMATGGALANWLWYEFDSSGALISQANPPTTPKELAPNPLTGVPMDKSLARNRPLAISLGNTTDALPMNGISRADIVYEVLVEGNYTRMIALFQDISDVPLVGSIRSARHYTAQIAESYDAIFVTAGGSQPAYDEIATRKIDHLDEVAGRHRQMFYRDRNRIPGKTLDNYHSAVTTGALVNRWLPTYNIRQTLSPNYSNRLNFTDNGTPSGGNAATDVTVRFTSVKTSSFYYNPDWNVYHMRQYNGNFVDANNNLQPAFANLLILNMSVSFVPNHPDGLRDIVTTGNGTGYFVSGGKCIEINWSRANKSSPFVYTLKNGTALTLGRGSTYIAIVPTNMNPSFK